MALLRLLEGWRDHAMRPVGIASLGSFWLSRPAVMDFGWPVGCALAVSSLLSSIRRASRVSREHRRKTDRLDTEMLIRVFLGWLRGEPRHCKMVAIPTLEEEDARRPSRERESLIGERTRIINRMKACADSFSASAASSRNCSRRHSAWKHHSIQRKACQSHQTCLMNCGAIWRDWLGSASRSMQSSRPGLNAWNRRRRWPARNGADVRQHRRCWCRDSGYAGAGDPVEKPSRSTGRGSLRRPHRVTRRERGQTT